MYKYNFSNSDDLSLFLKKEKFKKIFILCGKQSFINSGAKEIIEKALVEKSFEFFFKVGQIPEIKELEKIISNIKTYKPDLIIAVGGGSVLDYAKIANVLIFEDDLKKSIQNSSYNSKKSFTKLLAIPTTAGSGAEVTANAVIYINEIKYSIEGEKIKPDFFFLIPQLVIGASHKIKSSAGFDAIAQALESLISRKSNEQSVRYAKDSLNLSLKNYINYLSKPSFENTSAMCIAANLSGKAISISKTTAPHAVSYPFTAHFGISHGHAVSLTLKKFFSFNFKNFEKSKCNFDLKKRFSDIFNIAKVNNINDFDKYLLKISEHAKLENNFSKLGININENMEKILSGVNIQRLSNNPIELTKEDLKEIISE